MNSLISLLWQLEVQNIEIPTITIKNKEEKPHHYFYSEKQSRVLRKKDPKVIEYIDECRKKLNPPQIYQINRNRKDKILEIKMVEGSECCESLNDQTFEGQFAIIEPGYEVCIIRYFPPKSITVECLTGELSETKELIDWSSKFVLALENNKMKGKGKNKLGYVEVVIAVNDNKKERARILLIDAMKLRWDNDEDCVMKIIYDPICTQIKQKPQKTENKHKEERKGNIEKETGINIVEQDKKEENRLECCVCGELVKELDMKEIGKEELVSIRRMLKLSFRGFNDDYYEVCTTCYALT